MCESGMARTESQDLQVVVIVFLLQQDGVSDCFNIFAYIADQLLGNMH